MAELQAQGVLGIVTAGGSTLSHSAILARSLHLPMVVDAPQALQLVNDGDVLMLDGGSGLLVMEPNAEDLRAFKGRQREEKRERRQLHRLRREPSRTRDGVDIRLYANAESREDVAEAHALGAAGVGLYRTEYLFLQRPGLPDEEEQFRAYRDLVLGMTGRMVTIRTLDIGADKAALNADRAARNADQRREDRDLAKGNVAGAEYWNKKRAEEQHEVNAERRDLHHDRKDLRHDVKDRNHDVHARNDAALRDASQFGHAAVVQALRAAGATE